MQLRLVAWVSSGGAGEGAPEVDGAARGGTLPGGHLLHLTSMGFSKGIVGSLAFLENSEVSLLPCLFSCFDFLWLSSCSGKVWEHEHIAGRRSNKLFF